LCNVLGLIAKTLDKSDKDDLAFLKKGIDKIKSENFKFDGVTISDKLISNVDSTLMNFVEKVKKIQDMKEDDALVELAKFKFKMDSPGDPKTFA
jgi:hypothetical protein